MRARLFRGAGAATAAAAVAVLGLAAPGAAARAVVSGGTWGQAQEVLGALAWSGVVSVSCVSPGDCSAGGDLLAFSGGHQQAMVVDEKNGVWGKAEEVPGSAALNTAGEAEIFSVSCASAGNCSAGGWYRDKGQQAMVVSEKNGVWGRAEEVPGSAALNTYGHAVVLSVSCASPGDCSAGGYFVPSPGTGGRAFVIAQKNGRWGTALPIRGMIEVASVSCASAGNCSAGGGPFAVTETNGTWGQAKEVPGLAALSTGGKASINSVSCGSAGNCSAGGDYFTKSGFEHGFVVSQHNGTWAKAEQVPGLAALSTDGHAVINSVSCGSAGNCTAGGDYADHSGFQEGFVVTQDDGFWHRAEVPPGLAALNRDGSAQVSSVSCTPAGNCTAGGDYAGHSGFQQGFVASQDNGTWGNAEQVPGLAALNRGGFAVVSSVSCAPAGTCGAGGFYENRNHRGRAFVVSQAS